MQHRLRAFFVLSYITSWAYWIPVALTGGHASHFPGLVGPALAAVCVTVVSTGRPGLRDLATRAVRWRVPAASYLAVAVPLGVGLVAIALQWTVTGSGPSVGDLSAMPGLPHLGWLGVFVVTVAVNGLGEEMGWRGCAWPALRTRHSVTGSATRLGLLWAGWHAPLFWIDSGFRGASLVVLPGFVLGLVAGAVVLGTLYEQANSSVLVVALFHAMLNMFSATRGADSFVAPMVSAAVIVWAVQIGRSLQLHPREVATGDLRPQRA